MHTTGKVLTWLTAVAAVIAIYFGTRMLAVSNSWTRQLQAVTEQTTSNAATLEQRRREVADVRRRLERTVIGWDRFWHNVDAQPTAQGVDAAIGTDAGLGSQDGTPPPLVHGFVINEDGTTVYAGAFQPTPPLNVDITTLFPTWRLREGDAARWQAGKWRFRTLVPLEHRTRFVDYDREFALIDQKIEAQTKNLEKQTQFAEEAQANLDIRLQELNGGEVAGVFTDPALPPEYNEGLISVVNFQEAARDEVWADVDRLRRRRNELFETIQKLKADNLQLTTRLPQPTEPSEPAAAGDG